MRALYALALLAALAGPAAAQSCPGGIPDAAAIADIKARMNTAGDVLVATEQASPDDASLKSALRAYSSAWALTQVVEIAADLARERGDGPSRSKARLAAQRSELEFSLAETYVRQAAAEREYGGRVLASFAALESSMRDMADLMHACYAPEQP